MASLLDLPNEILEWILICAIDPQTDLDLSAQPPHLTEKAHETIAQVELVNHRFNDLAKPLKLQHWADTIDNGEDKKGGSLTFDLALLLLRKPELRTRLRHLEFRTITNNADGEEPDLGQGITHDDLSDLGDAVNRVPLPPSSTGTQPEWYRLFKYGNDGGIPALILEWATNVTNLALTIPYLGRRGTKDFAALLWLSARLKLSETTSTAPTLPLDNLKHVYLRWYDTYSFFSHKYAAPFYLLRKLRRLYAYRIGHDGDSEPNSDEDNGQEDEDSSPEVDRQRYYTRFGTPSDIEELHFVEADLSSKALGDLISHCRRLKSLRISWSATGNNIRNSNAWGYHLKLHAHSLEVLELDFSDSVLDWTQKPYRGNRNVDLGESLTHLRCLRKLRIESHFVKTHEDPPGTIDLRRLPASLEHFMITEEANTWHWEYFHDTVENYIDRGVGKVLQECKPEGRLPKLKTLDFTHMLPDYPKNASIVALKGAAKEQGVELKLMTMSCSSGVVDDNVLF